MKKLLTLLFALMAVTAMNAQMLKGDMNGDGEITMADANEVVNTYLGAKTAEELPVYTKSEVDAMLKKLEDRIAALEGKDGGGSEDRTPAGVEAVDLGLSVKWASCNIGASKPEEYGDYFAWGETEGYNTSKKSFSWSTYKWCNGSYDTLTKYCTIFYYGKVDNKTTLDPEDDAAAVNWGGSWRMPTKAEQDELRDNCTWTLTKLNGVNGYEVVSKKNGSSIFLPAAGYRNNDSFNEAGGYGYYWSSSVHDGNLVYADYLCFSPSGVNWFYSFRGDGRSVRAVCP